ncbi:hypothetical protein SO802_007175 [Lithocarpus litseifolius]|uniref:Secreted protein n=1 Tax=Lithocarpus litseifolius TaxID=425828 RepID=A0AAW2DMW0_9ROSI
MARRSVLVLKQLLLSSPILNQIQSVTYMPPTKLRSSARSDVDLGRQDRTFGDRRCGAGDGGNACASLLRALGHARRHEESPRGVNSGRLLQWA